MSDARIAELERQVAGLQAKNRDLESELSSLREARSTRAATIKKGGRWLIPLLDRTKVVRSFGDLAETVGRMTGPREQWPSRDDVVDRSRAFMEACVRFAVRRRTAFWVFSLVAASIPFMQLWVVVQQNEIIRNQNAFFEIQVHDVVSRSMTEGDRNARLMTGALLSRADLTFLSGVIEEAFDPELAGIYSVEGTRAPKRRLEDAAFRGFLIRAVSRGVLLRVDDDRDELVAVAQPMMHVVMVDAADRVPALLRFGERSELDPGLEEQVDNYLFQLGALIRTYARMARSEGLEESFAADVRPLLRRVSRVSLAGNRFAEAYKIAMDAVVLDAAVGLELGDDEIDWTAEDRNIDDARTRGIAALAEALGSEGIDWDAFEGQL